MAFDGGGNSGPGLCRTPTKNDFTFKLFSRKNSFLSALQYFSAVPGVGHSAQYQQCEQAHTDPPQAGGKRTLWFRLVRTSVLNFMWNFKKISAAID
jgi:hypothetical protein